MKVIKQKQIKKLILQKIRCLKENKQKATLVSCFKKHTKYALSTGIQVYIYFSQAGVSLSPGLLIMKNRRKTAVTY